MPLGFNRNNELINAELCLPSLAISEVILNAPFLPTSYFAALGLMILRFFTKAENAEAGAHHSRLCLPSQGELGYLKQMLLKHVIQQAGDFSNR